jgi:hypothetical protein
MNARRGGAPPKGKARIPPQSGPSLGNTSAGRNDDCKPYRVIVKKITTGALVTFSRYRSKREADEVVAALGRMKCPAHVEVDQTEAAA